MNFWKDAWTVDLILTHAGYIDLILVKNKKLVIWLDIKLDTIRLRNHFVAEFIFFAPFLKMCQHSPPKLLSTKLKLTYPIIGKQINLIEISMISAYWWNSIYPSQWAASISIIGSLDKRYNDGECPNQTHCWSKK